MAATTAWLQHAGERRLVAIKHKAWEDSGAYPKHARAERWTGGATEKLVVGHSKHDGEADVDGGVSVTAVDEMIKQQGTKHHGNMEKIEQHFARTEANCRAPATVKWVNGHSSHGFVGGGVPVAAVDKSLNQ